MSTISVNDRVRLTSDIYEPADDYSPGGYLAWKGEELIVRQVGSATGRYACMVSHSYITDNSFGVTADEIELIEGSDK